MRKLTFTLFCLFLFTALSSPVKAADLWPIEKTPWGMSRAETIKALGLSAEQAAPKEPNPKWPPEQQSIELRTTVTADGKTYPLERLFFFFDEKGLSGIRLVFQLPEDQDEKLEAARALYAEQAKILNGSYGEPLLDNDENFYAEGNLSVHNSIWQRDAATWAHLQRIENRGQYGIGLLLMTYRRPFPSNSFKLADKEKIFVEGMRKRITVIAEERQRPLQGEWKMTPSTSSKKVRAEYRCTTDLDAQQRAVASREALQIVTAMALEMVDLGITPSKENVTIRLRMYYSGKGLTGKKLVREYDEAVYDPEKDRVDWETPE